MKTEAAAININFIKVIFDKRIKQKNNLQSPDAKNKASKEYKVWLLTLGSRKLLLTIVFIALLTLASSICYGIGVYNEQSKVNNEEFCNKTRKLGTSSLNLSDKSELRQQHTGITKYKSRIISNFPQPNKNWLVPELDAELVYIRSGTFMLGSTKEEQKWAIGTEGKTTAKFILGEGDSPRRAEIKNAFWIGRTEVTVGQWRKFVKATSCKTDAEKNGKAWVYGPNDSKWTKKTGKNWSDPDYNYSIQDNFPVSCISWNDATAFCKWLTNKERKANRLPDNLEYRLPTEAEWEYACRGGCVNTKFWWGDNWSDAKGRANIMSTDPANSKGRHWGKGTWKDGWAYVSPVDNYGHKGRNGFGLADMTGNVQEWCLDAGWKDRAKIKYVKSNERIRVLRGGTFLAKPGGMRCARRNKADCEISDAINGFRIICGVIR